MAVWDKYEGRSPLFIDENRELYELDPRERLFKDDASAGISMYIDGPHDVYDADRPEWYAYVRGFREAADRLIEDFVAEGDSSMDARFLGNPILALYRHSVELAIKSILLTGGAARELDTLKSHDLDWLWKKAVEAIKREVRSAEGDSSLVTVGALIAELNEADKNSENFRYGVDKKLKPYSRRVEHIDVVNLRRVMFKLGAALEGCDTWLYEMQQGRWEAEAEMRQMYEAEMRQYQDDMRQEYGADMRQYEAENRDYYR